MVQQVNSIFTNFFFCNKKKCHDYDGDGNDNNKD